MKRAERRHHSERLKTRMKKELKQTRTLPITDKDVGKAVAVHNSGCSCVMCGNPRKFFNAKTLQERKAEQKEE